MRSLWFGLVSWCLAVSAGPAMEVKQPSGVGQYLRMQEDARSIVVSGETFSYTFDKRNGLVTSVRVLGSEIAGPAGGVPDLWLAEHLNDDHHRYAASLETEARVTVASNSSARVIIRAEGRYTDDNGRKFPLQYSLSYDISIDGVVLVQVKNTALEECAFRWLTLSAGTVRREHAQFLNWMPDQAGSQSTRYQFRSLADLPEGKVLAGLWIPWMWIGDQNRGLEVTTWDVGSQTYNRVDSTARTDEADMWVVHKKRDHVRWENFLVRRTVVHARRGWQRGGEFALAITPSKRFDPYYALLKGAHLGPHQHEERRVLPDERQIRTLAQNGYDLVVGMANWRSGEYVPLNQAALRETIGLCHKYGMKIIPYVTLVDLSHATEAFRAHGEEWAIEPTTEFDRVAAYQFSDPAKELAYRNDPEQQTTLMCPGAPGWREHWKAQIDRVIRDYDFDGLYIDFWYGRMVCENTRHGCGGRFRRHTVLGSRDMLTFAHNRLKAKNPRAIIKANTNTLATALITSLVDIRLVGESTDITEMDAPSRQWLYSSYRLGQPTEFLWDQSRWNPAQKAAFAALVNFLPKYYERPKPGPKRIFDDFDVYRGFDAGEGDWRLGISGDAAAGISPPQVVANIVQRAKATLITLINPSEAMVVARLPVSRGQLAYEPLAERRVLPSAEALSLDLAPGAYRHLLLVEMTDRPHLLCALGSFGVSSESWEGGARRLRVSATGVEGARIRYVVHCVQPPATVLQSTGNAVPFEWDPENKLVKFEVTHIGGETLELRF